eukprot:13094515-Alexandrium_andersonii.AAC.1
MAKQERARLSLIGWPWSGKSNGCSRSICAQKPLTRKSAAGRRRSREKSGRLQKRLGLLMEGR